MQVVYFLVNFSKIRLRGLRSPTNFHATHYVVRGHNSDMYKILHIPTRHDVDQFIEGKQGKAMTQLTLHPQLPYAAKFFYFYIVMFL